MIFRISIHRHTGVCTSMEYIEAPWDFPSSMQEYKSCTQDSLDFDEACGITYALKEGRYYDTYYVEGNDIGHAWSVYQLISKTKS